MTTAVAQPSTLLVRCSACERFFAVPKPPLRATQILLLDYAVCPHCETPRNRLLYENAGEKCERCGLPRAAYLWKGADGLCSSCYKARQHEREKMQEVKTE